MGEPKSEEVLDLLCDDYARQILAYLSNKPMVAEEIGEKWALVNRCKTAR